MKRSLYILTIGLLLGTLFLTACQTEALPGEQTGGGSETVGMPDTCYINLHIVNTSAAARTRATEAATSAENAIYDGIIAIFEGTSESAAILKSAVVIDQLINNPGNSTSIDVTQRLAGTHSYAGNKLYALVLLNTTSTGFRVVDQMLYLNNVSLAGKKRPEIQQMTINSVGSTDRHVGLYMTNTKKDDGTILRVVYPNEPSKTSYLYGSEEEARAAGAKSMNVDVERAAARVKVVNDIPAATALQNITLVGGTQTHPLIHKMTWAINNYNSGAYAIGGENADTGTPGNSFAAKDFTYFHQHSLESGDEVYVGPNNNSTKTQVVVEVQLKDGSFLLGDCFAFKAWDTKKLFTNVEALKDYYKSGWASQKDDYPAISGKSAEAVFRNLKVTIDANDQVVVTLTNSDFTEAEQQALNSLASTLSNNTTYFRDGKMYYTYTLDDLARNNAYNLSLVEEATTDTRQAIITFKFDQGSSGGNGTINFSSGAAELFTTSEVVLGSNYQYNSYNGTFSQTLVNPTTSQALADLDFLITPAEGWTFTPTRASFSTTRYGTDGGLITASWLIGETTTVIESDIRPYRNNNTPSILQWSHDISASGSTGKCGLRLSLSALSSSKQVGFSDIVITGTMTKASDIDSPQQSITGIGREKP